MSKLESKACSYAVQVVERFTKDSDSEHIHKKEGSIIYAIAELALSLDIITATTGRYSEGVRRIRASDGAVIYAPNAHMDRRIIIEHADRGYGKDKHTLELSTYTDSPLPTEAIVIFAKDRTGKNSKRLRYVLGYFGGDREATNALYEVTNDVSMNEFGLSRLELLDRIEIPSLQYDAKRRQQ